MWTSSRTVWTNSGKDLGIKSLAYPSLDKYKEKTVCNDLSKQVCLDRPVSAFSLDSEQYQKACSLYMQLVTSVFTRRQASHVFEETEPAENDLRRLHWCMKALLTRLKWNRALTDCRRRRRRCTWKLRRQQCVKTENWPWTEQLIGVVRGLQWVHLHPPERWKFFSRRNLQGKCVSAPQDTKSTP